MRGARGRCLGGDDPNNHSSQHGVVYKVIQRKIKMAVEDVIFRVLGSEEFWGNVPKPPKKRDW